MWEIIRNEEMLKLKYGYNPILTDIAYCVANVLLLNGFQHFPENFPKEFDFVETLSDYRFSNNQKNYYYYNFLQHNKTKFIFK